MTIYEHKLWDQSIALCSRLLDILDIMKIHRVQGALDRAEHRMNRRRDKCFEAYKKLHDQQVIDTAKELLK